MRISALVACFELGGVPFHRGEPSTKLFLAVAAFVAVTSIWMAATPILARHYPFCIKGHGYITPTGDCSFDTYEECLATASGRRNYCEVNPYFPYPNEPYVTHPKKRSK